MLNTPIAVSFFESAKSSTPELRHVPLRDLFRRDTLTLHAEPTPGAFDDPSQIRAYKASVMRGLYSVATFDGSRSSASVRSVSALAYDVDAGTAADAIAVRTRLRDAGLAYVWHTSFSYSGLDPMKYRLILPISRPLTPAEHARLWPVVGARYLDSAQDPQCKDPGRLFFGLHVQARYRDHFSLKFREGAPLDVEALLAEAPVAPEATEDKHADHYLYRVNRSEFVEWIKTKGPDSTSGEGGSRGLMTVLAKAVRSGIFDVASLLALDQFQVWNQHKASPPWSTAEIEHGFDSALARWESLGKAVLPKTMRGKTPVVRTDSSAIRAILEQDAEWRGKLWYDALTQDYRVEDRLLKNVDFLHIRERIYQRYPLEHLSKDAVTDTVIATCERDRRNPVALYLRSLVWDGVPRLDRVAPDVLRVDTDEHPSAALLVRKWYLSAAARGLLPGCKVDTALVLYGRQGAGKSTFFEVMAVDETWFSATDIDLRNKDALQALCTTWIYEWGELEQVFGAADMRAVKSLITRRVEKYRSPYGRVHEQHRRPGVVVGTTNDQDVLRDPTGSRRFWVISVGKVAIKKARAWRDQLWAEAVAMLDAGEQYHLTRSEQDTLDTSNVRYEAERPIYWAAREAAEKQMQVASPVRLQAVCSDIDLDHLRLKGYERAEIRQALVDLGLTYDVRRVDGDLIRGWFAPKTDQ